MLSFGKVKLTFQQKMQKLLIIVQNGTPDKQKDKYPMIARDQDRLDFIEVKMRIIHQ
jgi:hypothetical protein